MAAVDRKSFSVALRDYIIPLTTPFKANLELDLAGLRHNVRKALEIPASGGLYVGSVYQEFWTLTTAERKRLLEIVIEEAGPNVPVVAGVSSASAKTTIDLALHAESAGAYMLMVWPPIFGPRDPAGVMRFYSDVARHVSLPICVYSTTLHELGYYLDPRQLASLVAIDNIVCVKEASFSISTYLSLVNSLGDRLAISTPFEEYWMAAKLALPDKAPEFLMGSSRAMYMQSRDRPYLRDFLEQVRGGKIESAYGTLAKLQDIVTEIQMRSFASGLHPIAIVKFATELLGMKSGPVRPPTPSLSASDRDMVTTLMIDLGLIEAQPKLVRSRTAVAGGGS
jgi:dihydrodipicolinate synthase/N-acetylneuraminate lyase